MGISAIVGGALGAEAAAAPFEIAAGGALAAGADAAGAGLIAGGLGAAETGAGFLGGVAAGGIEGAAAAGALSADFAGIAGADFLGADLTAGALGAAGALGESSAFGLEAGPEFGGATAPEGFNNLATDSFLSSGEGEFSAGSDLSSTAFGDFANQVQDASAGDLFGTVQAEGTDPEAYGYFGQEAAPDTASQTGITPENVTADPTGANIDQQGITGNQNDPSIRERPADYGSGTGSGAGRVAKTPAGAFGQFNPGNLLSSIMRGMMGPSRPPQLGQASGIGSQLQGIGQQLIDNYNQGLLSGPMMAQLQSALQANLNKIRQYYRSAGNYNSTARIQAERNAFLQASASMATALQQELQQGMQALGQAGQLLLNASQQTISADNAFANSLMQSMNGILRIPFSGQGSGATATPQAAIGASDSGGFGGGGGGGGGDVPAIPTGGDSADIFAGDAL